MARTKKRETGDLGEKIAGRFLRSKGFDIVGWNYLKPWGEIDIITQKGEETHFIEVKTISVTGAAIYGETPGFLKKCKIFLSDKFGRPEWAYTIHESTGDEQRGGVDEYLPEDNLHSWKLERLKKAIRSYMTEKRMPEDADWQLDAVIVRIETKGKTALVEYLEDILA
jgi:Holliday junction resolvase-like predicted endonuclease